MHIWVGNLTSNGSDNVLSPGCRQAIIWTNGGISLIWPLGTNFDGIVIEIHTFSSKKMLLKMLFVKWRPFCLGLNVLKSITFWNNESHTACPYLGLLSGLSRINTSRPRWNGHHVADSIFKHIFYNKKVWIWIKTSLKGPFDSKPT